MRSIVDLLNQLRTSKVALSLDGEVLKISAPQGVLTKELREELGARKPEIIAFLRTSRQSQSGVDQAIPKADHSGPLPLSYTQQRLWFLNQLDPDSSVYNIGIALRMRGKLIVPAVERALQEIVRRHENLRTTFIQLDGVPQAVIGDANVWRLNIADARHYLDDGPGSQLFQRAAQEFNAVFDIIRGPLFRASLLIIGPEHHFLVLSMHHLISDGWSIGVVLKEFSELYTAHSAAREPSLAALSVQYSDFAVWHRKWLESVELQRQLPYWKKQLAGAPPVVGFPADHKRPASESSRGVRAKLVIPRELVSELEQISRRHGVTLFMSLLASFNILLARYTGLDDIVLGSPSANRIRPELNSLIGFFVNNLVLRTDLSGDPSFVQLLGRVREMTLRSYEHQDVPFDVLVHTMRLERSLEHSPLFQVMFAMQNFPLDELDLSGVTATAVELEIETARFDLTVEVFPRNHELWAYFDYNADLYDPETILQLQRHYVAILRSVCTDPEQKIGSISLLSDSERQKLLIEWNQTAAEVPEICFHQHFEAHAQATPDRLAVIAGNESLTYAELDRRSNRIAAHLKALGAGPEKLIALCLERSADLVAGILGIAKSGAAYIPLDPAYPKGRIANIFEDAQPLVVLTATHLQPLLPDGSMRVVCVDALDPVEALSNDGAPLKPVAPEKLAYVIFTSGSTGRPKGVQITHRSLVNFLEGMKKEPSFSSNDVLLAVTTPSFDIAALELLLPLYTGATVCIARQPADPGALLADLNRYRPTVMQATPATWKLLIAAGWKGNSQLKILCGGEALDAILARSLLVRSGTLWNMYGPTETTIWSAVLRVDEGGGSAIPIGRPIQNTSFYVLDQWRQPVPQGVSGELWIGGEGVARGYLNRPDLTSERFIPSPFSDRPGDRLYRTGDLVRYRPDGTFDFFGRMDHQIKFRGFRIELGEIENALRHCPGVLDAVTLLREDNGDKRLVGYLICAEGDTPSVTAVREHLRSTLTEYMIPGEFVFLKEFPRLPNGKLDRSALPTPERGAGDGKPAFSEPATGLEQTVAAAFRHALNMETVRLDDNFFDMGAHSLQIVKVHGELNQSIERKIPLISFFQYPTIRSLARFIEQSSHKEVLSVAE